MIVKQVALIVVSAAAFPATSASLPGSLWPDGTGRTTLTVPQADAVERLLGQLSLEEKVGQMIQADIASITPQDLRTYKLGSILAGGNAAPSGDIRSKPQAWLKLTNDFHQASLNHENAGHPPIPILFGIDAVHGDAKIKGATIFPHNIALGAANDPELIRRIGAATAAEVAATGIDWTFAPTVAVVRDVRWGRSYESYSESPRLVATYAAAMVRGLQGERGTAQFMSPGHTLSSVKHFIGDGGTLAGRDQGDTVLSETALSRIHAAGYPAAIDAGALIVMASYNSWNGIKLHANHYLLTDILKGRLGFSGFVVGDWNAHEQIAGCTKSDCAPAILAGIDMLMAPDDWKLLFQNTVEEARSGRISPSRIDDAVRRILRVKMLAGLLERPRPKPRQDGDFAQIGSAAHREIARMAVRESLVLLKNQDHTLPLDSHARVLVVGSAADDIGIQCGGWTIDWQGDHNTNADFPGATSIYQGLRTAFAAGGGSATLSLDGSFSQRPDAAIVVFGETPYAEFEGDRETLEYSPQDKTTLGILRRLRQQGIRTVSVFLSGRPLWINPEMNASDAFVAAWLPGSEGEGVADVLVRAPDGTSPHRFRGRLGFSWPMTAMPVSFDAHDAVQGALFARGFGLDADQPSPASTLPEASGIPAEWQAPSGSLFHAQHATAPWSIFVADDAGEVHLTNLQQDSPRGSVSVTLSANGLAAVWSGIRGGRVQIAGRAADLRARVRDNSAVLLRYRIDTRPDKTVVMSLRCTELLCGSQSGATLDLTATMSQASTGTWNSLVIPLSCFAARGADLSSVEVPFAIETDGHFALTIDDIRVGPAPASLAGHCP